MTGITLPNPTTDTPTLRPVNLQTDLGQLADLIESAFASTMDAGGRAAIREMRQLSRVGFGMGLVSRLNDLAQGMSLGYVWVEDGRIVGNVSVYPADYPTDMGKVWIIANVAVYPAYQGRGIAKRLMQTSLNMIENKSGGVAVLQVDHDNDVARGLYRRLGFREERTWTQWRRPAYTITPAMLLDAPASSRIVSRRWRDAAAELALAQQVRPQSAGGLDWQEPTHPRTFRPSLMRRLNRWLNLREFQHLVIHDEQGGLRAWMRIETAFGVTGHQVKLMAAPNAIDDARALLAMAVRRYGDHSLMVSHPYDDTALNDILRLYQFSPRRTVVHMHWEP